MSAEVKPGLEALRKVTAPAWLWDPDRKRIVWANDAGVRALSSSTLLELVERSFDANDPGIERLSALASDLSWGNHRTVLLHLPSAGTPLPISCHVYVHVLADGRTGLLTVVDESPQPGPAAATEAGTGIGPPHPGSVAMTSKSDAFAALKKSLADSLTGKSARPSIAAAAASPAPQPATAPVPLAVRQALDVAKSGIIVCRDGAPLFANARAAALCSHDGAAALLADAALIGELHAVPPGLTLAVHVPRPGAQSLLVSRHPLPWHNGPAEQFSLRPSTMQPTGLVSAPAAHPVTPPAANPNPEPLSIEYPAHDRKQLLPTLREVIDLEELKAILDVASDGIIMLDRNGGVLSLSSAAESIFGLTAAEAAGRPFATMLHPDSHRAFQDYLAGLTGRGLAAVFNDGREMLALKGQGGSVPLFMTIGRTEQPRAMSRFCVVVRDLTAWKQTEQDLVVARDRAVDASRQKSELLAHVSHELRTPLNAILGFSEVMRTQRFGPLGNEKYLTYANDIHASGSHLLSVVSDLLDLSRIEAGRQELDFMAVSLEDVADYTFNLLREQAGASGIILRKSFPSDLPRVVADAKCLRQVMINLVSNAIKFSNAGSEVLVSATFDKQSELKLRVKDAGIGMSRTELAQVLKPYGRIEKAARQRPGTGLGLSLTKSLVEANKASFSITSESGRGTLVEIAFPGPRVLAG